MYLHRRYNGIIKPLRVPKDAALYNSAALEVIAKNFASQITSIDDQFTVISNEEKRDVYFPTPNVHPRPEGYQAVVVQASEKIRGAFGQIQ